jgi:hypothetical protein
VWRYFAVLYAPPLRFQSRQACPQFKQNLFARHDIACGKLSFVYIEIGIQICDRECNRLVHGTIEVPSPKIVETEMQHPNAERAPLSLV